MITDTPKKIIIYCHNDYATAKGGEYNVFNNDVLLLEKIGYKVIRYETNNNIIFKTGIIKRILIMINSLFSIKVYREVRSIIKREKVEYAFVQNTFLLFSPSIYIALFNMKIPIVQMIYNYRFMCANAHLFTNGKICERCIKGSYYNAVLNKCVRNSIAISIWYAIILFVTRKIFKIENKISAFVVPDEFSKIKHTFASIEKKKIVVAKNPFTFEDNLDNEHGDEGYFLFIGRIIKQKGIYTFLKAARKLPDRQFKIIGIGEEENNIRRFINDYNLKNVEFIGPLYGTEMINELKNARALIVPSEWYDNYPVVIAIAYNYLKPVIATNINGLPEVVINNKTGLLFGLGNVDDLCIKIEYLGENEQKAKELGVNGRLFLKNELNNEKRIKIIQEVLENVKQL